MNKLFTKIAAVVLGATMATGVGVAVASNSKETTPVHATETSYTITFKTGSGDGTKGSTSTAMSSYTSSSYVTGNATTATNAYYAGSSGLKLGTSSASGSLAFNLATSGQVTATKVTVNAKRYNSSKAATIKLGNLATQNLTSSFADYEFALTGALTSISITTSKYAWVASVSVYYNASTPLTGITLGGAASQNALSIGSSDLTAKTVSVTLNPLGATDQKVNIAHQSGTSGLFTVSSSATCTSGSGSFTVTGKGNTSGSETFRIKGNTETSVYVDLVVTALDDSVTYWTVSFDSDGGASIGDMSVEDGEKFEFPSPGTKTHYSFDGWSSDGGNTLYDEGEESPTVVDDIEYMAYWTEDSKYTVTYVHGDHGTGNDYVVNNVYGGSYTLATFATAGFEASSGYSFKKWSVGGVEYAEGATVTISGATTVTAVYQEVTTYTIVTSVANLVEDTTFVLVYETSGSYYVDTAITSNHVALTAKTDATTISNGVSSGSTLVSTEAMVLTLKGSEGAWKIKCGDQYLKFTGSSNGNDAFDTEANASTFSASIKDDKYILFTCTSSTGNGRVWRMNTSSKDMRNYATNSGVGDVYMFAYIPPSNELDHVTTSGQTTSFTAGNTFSYGGTLTAYYTIDDPATKTPTSFKLDSESGKTITTSTVLTKAAHDGHEIYVLYTEGGITKSAHYTISVSYAAVTSVVIDEHAAEIGLEELYDGYKTVGVTVNSQYADQGYEWIVSANTVNDDYSFDESGLKSKNTEGTITLRCRSTADNSKFDELVVTVTGDPTAAFDKESASGYAGKTEAIGFTYGNMDDVSKIVVASSNTSYVTVANDLIADEGVGLVTINFVAAGSANVTISYDGGSALASMSVTVSADSVVSVSWEATNFDVFSGTTLTSDIDNTWLASYEMASGDEGLLEYGDYTLKLGGSAITLPHTWVAADDGKTLCIEYGGVSSSTVLVAVTQSINAVYAPNTVTDTVSWTASAAADLGSQISSEGDTDTGTISTGTYSWNYTRTLTSLTSGKSDNISFQGSTWIQLGSNNSMESIEFSTSEIPGTIKSVTVVVATAGSHVLTIDVGGTKYLEDESLHLYSGTAAAANPDPDDCIETGTGSSSGAITITIAPTASTKKAMVIRSISVTYETGGSGKTNIANDPAHKAAQRAAVAYAQAFNAAMDETENCTTGLDAAWSTCSSAYDAFKSAAAALGETEEAWAKNLVKYATAQYSDDSAEACLERMMKTYEICVQKHGKTAFMSDLVTLGRAPVNPIAVTTNENINTIAIVAIVSVISVSAIGGYFFLRKRKETN